MNSSGAAPIRLATDQGAFSSRPKGERNAGTVSENDLTTASESIAWSNLAAGPASAAALLIASTIKARGERASPGGVVVSVIWLTPTMTGIRLLSITTIPH